MEKNNYIYPEKIYYASSGGDIPGVKMVERFVIESSAKFTGTPFGRPPKS